MWAGIPKTQSFNSCPFLTLSVRNGPRDSFGTNVPCIIYLPFYKNIKAAGVVVYHDLVSILLTINFPASVDYIIIEISYTHLQTLLYIYTENTKGNISCLKVKV